MQRLVREYLDDLNRHQKKRRKIIVAVTLLVVLVVGTIEGILTQYGVAMTDTPRCGLEEHTHTNEECMEKKLVCGQEEGGGHIHTDDCKGTPELICGLEESEGHIHEEECYTVPEEFACGQEESEGEGHMHGDECYAEELTCGKNEHVHTEACYAESGAEVKEVEEIEGPAVWDAQYANTEWKKIWGEDLVKAAQMQMGYKESQSNYMVADDGTHKGYSRYGHFSGDMYMYQDWDAAFVNFCIHYAGLGESELFPKTVDSAEWQNELIKISEASQEYLTVPTDYEPKTGDIIFFNREKEETAVQMGIVSAYDRETNEITVIEGNSENEVKENQYGAGDEYIAGYLKISEMETAVKSGDQIALAAEEPKEEPNFTDGDMYVNEFRIRNQELDKEEGVVDGSGPFDEDDKPGNDRDASNKIVRTFDTVQYKFRIDMKSSDESIEYHDARIMMKFVLPATEEEAVFDKNAMLWLEGYEVNLEKRADSETGEEKDVQVLTGSVHLHSDVENVVPGYYKNNVTIKIKNMKQGDALQPTFSAAMYGNEEESSWKEISPETVRVSAAPKYNIQIAAKQTYRDIFDFNTGTQSDEADGKKGSAANYGMGNVIGRAVQVGVVLQLCNDNSSKGMKGIELPDSNDDITFTLKTGSEYRQRNGDILLSKEQNVDYKLLLWSFEGSQQYEYGKLDQNGRVVYDNSWSRELVPDNMPNGEGKSNACYNGGTWKAVQNADGTTTVTVSGWEINPDQFPKRNGFGDRDVYGSHIGCFSAGEFVFVQPFNKIGSGKTDGDRYDILDAYGSDGGFYVEIEVVGKDQYGDLMMGEKTYLSQDRNLDYKIAKTNIQLSEGEVLANVVGYLAPGWRWISPGFTKHRVGYFNHGDSFVLAGEKVDIAAGLNYKTGDDQGSMYLGTNLMKFDADKLELTGNFTNQFDGTLEDLDGNEEGLVRDKNTFVYYAAKKDGKNWDSTSNAAKIKEMEETYEEDLLFYKSLDDLEAAGKICVGVLTCFKGKSWENTKIGAGYQLAYEANVLEGEEKANVGTTAYVVATSRAWTKTSLKTYGLDPDTNPNPDFEAVFGAMFKYDESFSGGAVTGKYKELLTIEPQNTPNRKYHLYHANFGTDRGQYYIPEEYETEYGTGIKNLHNSEYFWLGDTLLIIGYNTEIEKSLMQQVADKYGRRTEKTTFDLNQDQKVVDYKLTPNIDLGKDDTGTAEQTTTVTIVDTLPEHMKYIPNSAYFGGEYGQTSIYGGRQGTITEGRQGTVTRDENGFILEDGREKDAAKRYYDTSVEPTVETKVFNKIKTEYGEELTVEPEKIIKEGTAAKIKIRTEGGLLKIVNCEITGEVKKEVLTWTLNNVRIADQLEPIYYSAKITNSIWDEPDKIVALDNEVYIYSEGDNRERTLKNGNMAVKGISATRAEQAAHGKTVSRSVVEENGEYDYTVYYNNYSTGPQNALIVDTMPKDNVLVAGEKSETFRSKFDGSYRVTEWKLEKEETGETEALPNVIIYYATKNARRYTDNDDENGIEADTLIIPKVADWEWTENGWEQAGVDADGKITFDATKLDGAFPEAWAAVGWVQPREGIHVNMHVKLNLDLKQNKVTSYDTNRLVNVVTSTATSGSKYVATETVRRILEGYVWQDDNRDGLQDEGEKSLSNVKVQLLKCDKDGKPLDKDPICEIMTGQQASVRDGWDHTLKEYDLKDAAKNESEAKAARAGHYRFTDLPPGTYAIRFIPGEAIEYKATKVDAGGDDTIDSDAEPEYGANEKLTYTQISNIEMPTTKEIGEIGKSGIYRLEHNDSGLYPNSGVHIKKMNETRTQNLRGAVFTVREQTTNKAVSFIEEEKGQYRLPELAVGTSDNGRDEFYLALASDPNKVLTVVTDESDDYGYYVEFQERTGKANQRFSYPFLYPDDGNPDPSVKLHLLFAYPYDDGTRRGLFYMNGKEKYWPWSATAFMMPENISDVKFRFDYPEHQDHNPNEDHWGIRGAKRSRWYFDRMQNGAYKIRTAYDVNYVPPATDSDGNPYYDSTVWPSNVKEKYLGIGANNSVVLCDGKNSSTSQFLMIPVPEEGKVTELEVDDSGNLKIENLKQNMTYVIEEIKSPIGYRVLSSPIELKVDGEGKVAMTPGSGGTGDDTAPSAIQTSVGDKSILELDVRNDPTYELPSTGGIGIYWYMISGMFLMMGASLILYRSRSKKAVRGW